MMLTEEQQMLSQALLDAAQTYDPGDVMIVMIVSVAATLNHNYPVPEDADRRGRAFGNLLMSVLAEGRAPGHRTMLGPSLDHRRAIAVARDETP